VVEDESGFSLVSPLKRTWAPRGQTPCVRTSLDHHERLNLLGAVLVTPKSRRLKLMIRSHRRTLRGEEVIAFLTALLRRIRGPIVLVWDNHPIHQRKLVQAFLAQQNRLHVYDLPTGAPELNPMEGVWQQVMNIRRAPLRTTDSNCARMLWRASRAYAVRNNAFARVSWART